MAVVFLALGSNLGNRLENLQHAVNRLAPFVQISHVSSIYETEPWGITEQPRFLNMVVEGETALAPEELLGALKTRERELGRTETVRYGPRLIDIDILFYDDLIYKSDALEIPHPRLAERRFVLVPLADIAPDLLHPSLRLTVRELLAQLPDTGDVKLYPMSW